MWTVVQLLGLVAALAGLWLLVGLAWVLLVGGLGLVALGVLAELAARPRTVPARPVAEEG